MRPRIRTILAFTATASLAALMTFGVLRDRLTAEQAKSQNSLGKEITKLDLPDTAGKTWSVGDLKGKKAVVVLFLGTQCPVNNFFMPKVAELHKAYAAKDVLFLAINSNKQDTSNMIKAHIKEFGIPFAVLKDEGQVVADRFGATRTPEAFVLDQNLKICYQGRINDQFGAGFQRSKADREDLTIALDELLAGNKITVASTEVAGCLIGRLKAAPVADAKITYSKHVAPIIQNRCQECHRPGQIAPMPLLNYDDVSNWSAMIREVVSEKRMPPWHADEKHNGVFANQRSLSKEDYHTLLAWIDAGCPEGSKADLPAPRQFADTWYIGKPDAVVQMPQEFTVPAKAPKGGVRYQNFSVKTNFNEDKWIQASECRPGNKAVVHHIIAFIDTGKKLDLVDGLGYGMLSAYAPGDIGSTFPPGAAMKLPKGATIRFQMHYTPNGVECKDRSSVALIFAKETPKIEVQARAVANLFFNIPPNQANHEVKSESTFKKDTIVYSLLPHMHLRGKDFKYDVVYPDGKTETILNVPHYDFGWQAKYHFKEPLKLPAGSKIKCLAHFDNSKGNPWNPDPTASVRFGEQTWEEMMIGFIDYAYVEPK